MSIISTACLHSRGAVTEGTTVCRACGSRLSSISGKAQAGSYPPIWITTDNYHPLKVFALRDQAGAAEVGDFLLKKLARAVVCAPEWIAPDVVTMNSRVTFAVGKDARPQTRLLVYPDRHSPTGQSLSVLSPFGAALIGITAGSTMAVSDRQGFAVAVRVEHVVYQP